MRENQRTPWIRGQPSQDDNARSLLDSTGEIPQRPKKRYATLCGVNQISHTRPSGLARVEAPEASPPCPKRDGHGTPGKPSTSRPAPAELLPGSLDKTRGAAKDNECFDLRRPRPFASSGTECAKRPGEPVKPFWNGRACGCPAETVAASLRKTRDKAKYNARPVRTRAQRRCVPGRCVPDRRIGRGMASTAPCR